MTELQPEMEMESWPDDDDDDGSDIGNCTFTELH
jgi:hypothetical protein